VSARSLSFLFAAFLLAAFTSAAADEEEAYFGEWSNERGDVLRVTAETIQLNDDKSLRYDDITEDSDGSFYLLQITTSGEANSFEGKYIRITFGSDADRFTLITYRTHADALNQRNESSRSEWVATDDED
jgi:hypothetical protein